MMRRLSLTIRQGSGRRRFPVCDSAIGNPSGRSQVLAVFHVERMPCLAEVCSTWNTGKSPPGQGPPRQNPIVSRSRWPLE
jgi:hypothetical protein